MYRLRNSRWICQPCENHWWKLQQLALDSNHLLVLGPLPQFWICKSGKSDRNVPLLSFPYDRDIPWQLGACNIHQGQSRYSLRMRLFSLPQRSLGLWNLELFRDVALIPERRIEFGLLVDLQLWSDRQHQSTLSWLSGIRSHEERPVFHWNRLDLVNRNSPAIFLKQWIQ